MFDFDGANIGLVFLLSKVVVEGYFTRIFLPLWM